MGKLRNFSLYSTIQTSNKQFTGQDLTRIVSEFPEAVNSKKNSLFGCGYKYAVFNL